MARKHPTQPRTPDYNPRALAAQYRRLAGRCRRRALIDTLALAERQRWGEGNTMFSDFLADYRVASIAQAREWLDLAISARKEAQSS